MVEPGSVAPELREELSTSTLEGDAAGGCPAVFLDIVGCNGIVEFVVLTPDDDGDDNDNWAFSAGLAKMLRISFATSSNEMLSVFNNFSCTLLSAVPAGALER